MSRLLRVIISLFSLSFLIHPAFSQTVNSVLSKGDWYKLTIEKDGVYKITHSKLREMGIDPNAIDPRKIQVYGDGSGMLPQPNNTPRPADLIQNKISIPGESDGKFDTGDYILFYAQGADKYSYDNGSLEYEHNIYSDFNYYFLTIGETNGLRIEDIADKGTGYPKIKTFNTHRYYEKEATNVLSSGREWYGENLNSGSRSYSFTLNGLVPSSEIKVTSAVMAQSFAESMFKVSLNGISLGEQVIENIPDFTNEIYRYSVKGRENIDEFIINSNQISGNEIKIALEYIGNSSGYATGNLNYLIIEALCPLSLSGEYTIFRSIESTNNALSTFEILSVTDQTKIWDVTDPLLPDNQQFSKTGSIASFGAETSEVKDFVVFDPKNLPAPTFEKISNQNIRSASTPDLLIVTHPNFLSEAERLAGFRRSNDNLAVVVVTTEQIYNEFASGKQDVVAIRDYVKHLYDASNKLKYLLLFGRGSFDYKDVLVNNTNYVPVYQSRNTLHPLDTYTSDDFYGFMDDNEGEWPEVAGGNHTLEIGIGRLPVTSTEEAKTVVNKLIEYSTSQKSLGPWRNDVVFVADDGDGNTHTEQSDYLSLLLDTTFSDFNYKKLFLDAYPQISGPNEQTAPKANDALTRLIKDGALVVNFTGHGREQGWTSEDILTIPMIETWDNKNRLPLFVTATCEFGRHDDPATISGGEKIVTNPIGGGIGIISTCRPVFSSSNFALNKAFYSELFKTENGNYPRLGDIIRLTKNKSIDQAIDVNKVGNRNFSLLGDPSLQLNYPKKRAALTSVNGNIAKSDTLKALGKVIIEGEIQEINGLKDGGFNGVLEAVIYDKEAELVTLGDENTPYTYKSRENAIFRGQSSIVDGEFKFEFIVPKNISYKAGKGKISLYATHENKVIDANGSNVDMMVGGTIENPPVDNAGPEINIYFGDSTYRGTGKVDANTLLVAKLFDESGINISEYGIGNNIIATLDGQESFILNDYYVATKDSYKSGWVSFPLNDLAKGKHTLTLKAWDTHNNSGEKQIEFMVGEPGDLSITNLRNYPNPFRNQTTIAFDHNRSGENLEINLQIISRSGEVIRDLDFQINESTAHLELFEWDGTNTFGQKLQGGIYLFKVSVRSMADGVKNQRYEKLILIN